MPQLIVRKIEAEIVRRLKKRAGEHGLSMEEEHRRILRQTLGERPRRKPSFKEFLRAIPEGGPDDLFARPKDRSRKVEL